MGVLYNTYCMAKNTDKKTDIALRDLMSCIVHEGFVAGSHHFVDLWARDSLFATFGANVSGLSKISKKTIETFLRHQKSNGYIPYLILRSKHSIGKYFGKQTYYDVPKGISRSHMSFGTVPDGGVMTVIAAKRYVEQTGDIRFLSAHYQSFVRAITWYTRRFHDGLIHEWFQCEWADALMKSGRTLYTNVLYFRAMGDMAWLAKKLKKEDESRVYASRATHIQFLLNRDLWNGTYFADWKDWKRQDYFATHPNMLAIIFGLATKRQASSILLMAKQHAWNGWTLINSVPRYPIWRVPIFHIIVGMRDYHNGLLWLQPGILYAVALFISGKRAAAKSVLLGIEKKINASLGAHEVYEENGTPVHRLVYRSEQPFAWSSGLFVWASAILKSARYI